MRVAAEKKYKFYQTLLQINYHRSINQSATESLRESTTERERESTIETHKSKEEPK